MKITFHGHSALMMHFENGQSVLFDPFINGNPLSDLDAKTVQADFILITHGHDDHVGDMLSIAKRNDATVVGIAEIAAYAEKFGVRHTHGMNLGGAYDFPFGRVKLVPAMHSSGLEVNGQMTYMGEPAGFLIEAEGKTIYVAGDTAYFSDMALLGERYSIDLAFLPIGDNFTMGPEEAVYAAEKIKAKQVVPIHYDTFPVIKQDPKAFVEKLPATVGKVLAVGESIEL